MQHITELTDGGAKFGGTGIWPRPRSSLLRNPGATFFGPGTGRNRFGPISCVCGALAANSLVLDYV